MNELDFPWELVIDKNTAKFKHNYPYMNIEFVYNGEVHTDIQKFNSLNKGIVKILKLDLYSVTMTLPFTVKKTSPIPLLKHVILIDSLFENCRKLKTIPSDLFKYNPQIVSFIECFAGSGLQEIPNSLFKYNIHATDFDRCFAYCDNLKNIPEDLFVYNKEINIVIGCFRKCKNIKKLDKLFLPDSFDITKSVIDSVFYDTNVKISKEILLQLL